MRTRARRAFPTVMLSAAASAVLAGFAVSGDAGGGAEATDRWIRWHRQRALELRAESRLGEAIEEMLVVSNLNWTDPYPVSEAAVLAIDAASVPGRTATAVDPLVMLADRLVGEGVRRGGLHDPGLAYVIGRIAMLNREHDRAWTMLSEARRRGFDPVRAEFWSFRAAVNVVPGMLDRGRTDDAIDLLRAALDRNPEHPDRNAALLNLATSYRRRADHSLAEAVVRDEILSRSPKNAKAWDVLGQIYADYQNFDEGAKHARTAMEYAKESDDGTFTGPAVYAEAVYHCATFELRRGRVPEARALAEQYLRLRRDAADGLYLMGMIRQAMGTPEDLREAAILLRRACYADGTDDTVASKLVEVLHAIGEDAEAATWQARAEAIRAKRAAKPNGHGEKLEQPDAGHK